MGAFLDPVADKLLVCVCLVLLTSELRLARLPTAVIVGREVAVSALREWAAGRGASKRVAVSSIGKLKTAVQMISLLLLMLARPGNEGMTQAAMSLQALGLGSLYLSALLACMSAYKYAHALWPLLSNEGANHRDD